MILHICDFLSLFSHGSNFIDLDTILHFFCYCFYSVTTYCVDHLYIIQVVSFCRFFVYLVESLECNWEEFFETRLISDLHLVECAGKCNRAIKYIWSVSELSQTLFSKVEGHFKAVWKQFGHWLLFRIFFLNILDEYQWLIPYVTLLGALYLLSLFLL